MITSQFLPTRRIIYSSSKCSSIAALRLQLRAKSTLLNSPRAPYFFSLGSSASTAAATGSGSAASAGATTTVAASTTTFSPISSYPCKFFVKGLSFTAATVSCSTAPPNSIAPPSPSSHPQSQHSSTSTSSDSSVSPQQQQPQSPPIYHKLRPSNRYHKQQKQQRRLFHHSSAMAQAATIQQLAGQVEGLSLDSVANTYPDTYPNINPLDLWRAHISNILSSISGVSTDIVYRAIAWTQGLDRGDFTLAVPALRIKGAKPDALASEWASKWPEDDALVSKPVVNAHFMSFFLKGEPLLKTVIPMVREQGSRYGNATFHGLKDPKDPSKGQKKMIVEFSSPNVAKPFHAGHLRSTIIGGFLANLHQAAGWDVTRINYLGDWGKQYGLLALAYERYGVEEELNKDPINHLFKLYVQINSEMTAEKERFEALQKEGTDTTEMEANSLDEQARRYFKRMTEGDEVVLAQWQKFRDLSIVRYKETYARLNIHFDEYSGESQVSEETMAKTAKIMEEKKISHDDQGAVLIDFTGLVPGKEGKRLGKAVLRKKDGTALYLTRDVSELLNRYEKYSYDKMFYVIASQQDLHVKQLFKITELMGNGDIAKRCQHISFGLVLGMSTRKGTVKFLNDILGDCADHMHETMKKNEEKYKQIEDPKATADILGISSVMVQDLTGKMINNYTFNMDAMTSFEGDTGPYLQYAHARLWSIKRRAQLSDEDLNNADLSLLKEDHAVNIVRMLAQWPDVFQNTLKTLEPTTVLTYLFRMTHSISSSYDHLQVIGSEPELMKARMALYDAARIVLYNGMRLLGLSPLERM